MSNVDVKTHILFPLTIFSPPFNFNWERWAIAIEVRWLKKIQSGRFIAIFHILRQ